MEALPKLNFLMLLVTTLGGYCDPASAWSSGSLPNAVRHSSGSVGPRAAKEGAAQKVYIKGRLRKMG
jgi:hypothetical protein